VKGVKASHSSPLVLTGVPLALVARASAKPRVPERTYGRRGARDQKDPTCPGGGS
jgi:hypothetical protein